MTDYATERMWVTADGIASVKAKIAGYTDMKLKGLIYLNDENVGLFQNPQAVVPGKVAHNNREVTLSGWENVVAYELCEGDRIIMIAQRKPLRFLKYTEKSTGQQPAYAVWQQMEPG